MKKIRITKHFDFESAHALYGYDGKCKNKAYREVYPSLLKKGSGWCYLCKKHFLQEQKRLKNKLPYCSIKC